MDRARATGEWVLRVYSWAAPTISLGRNQTARGRYDLDRTARARARRRASAHRWPGDSPRSRDHLQRHRPGRRRRRPRAVVRADQRAAARGRLRVARRRGRRWPRPTSRAATPGMAPCFDEPSAGELTVGGRKLAGSAQWRADGALLQHGSILDGRRSEPARRSRARRRARHPTTGHAAEALGRAPSVADVADALARRDRTRRRIRTPIALEIDETFVPERRLSSSDT